jgi:hypothetical protein
MDRDTFIAALQQENPSRFIEDQFFDRVLRLWSDPGIGPHVISNQRFDEFCDLPEGERLFIAPFETRPRHFPLGTIDPSSFATSLKWIQENLKVAHKLYSSSTKFQLAADRREETRGLWPQVLRVCNGAA